MHIHKYGVYKYIYRKYRQIYIDIDTDSYMDRDRYK